MLYYLDESDVQGGFADGTLNALGYTQNPRFLQGIIDKVFELAIKEVCVEGTEVIPFPLFSILDGKDTADYVHRVEPSVAGGEKLGRALGEVIRDALRVRAG